MSKKSKKNSRKLSLESDSPLAKFFKNDEKLSEIKPFLEKYRLELRINHQGFLVLKGIKPHSDRFFAALMILGGLKREITINDIKDALDGKELTVEAETRNRWDNIPFHHKNGTIFNIRARNQKQQNLIDTIVSNPVTYALGSPGTGKSLLALAVGLKMLEQKQVKKVIVTRPLLVVGAEEAIGYLPGSKEDKLGIYHLATMGLLTELVGKERRDKLLSDGQVELMPLGFLRGMTLSSGNAGRDALFFICDEAQNLTWEQNKLILTRFGDAKQSRFVFAGDTKQSDLVKSKKDTLLTVYNTIKNSPHVKGVFFTKDDVVRSIIVKDLLGRLEEYEDLNFK